MAAPPKIQITSPAPYTVFISGENITINAKATGQVEYTTFIIDNIILGYDYTKPYSITFNSNIVPVGYHNIQAQAINSQGEGAAYVSGIFIE